jgi:hypothetical protein
MDLVKIVVEMIIIAILAPKKWTNVPVANLVMFLT